MVAVAEIGRITAFRSFIVEVALTVEAVFSGA
jgi:hypothetical protein